MSNHHRFLSWFLFVFWDLPWFPQSPQLSNYFVRYNWLPRVSCDTSVRLDTVTNCSNCRSPSVRRDTHVCLSRRRDCLSVETRMSVCSDSRCSPDFGTRAKTVFCKTVFCLIARSPAFWHACLGRFLAFGLLPGARLPGTHARAVSWPKSLGIISGL